MKIYVKGLNKDIEIPDLDINDPRVLENLRSMCQPHGRVGRPVNQIVVALVDAIADEKGFDIGQNKPSKSQ